MVFDEVVTQGLGSFGDREGWEWLLRISGRVGIENKIEVELRDGDRNDGEELLDQG